MDCCCMKGYLSYLILWCLSKRSMNGVDLANELCERRGTKPSPGTIYPALKELKEKKLVSVNEDKKYTLTKKGEKELEGACKCFCRMFFDMKEMFEKCKCIK